MPSNIHGFDLNLLLVFDAVMTERSVSRAARRIGLSQPAVSNALNRLRDQLQDQLFIRTSTGVRPTDLANEMATDVAEGLRQLQMALEPRENAMTSLQRRFVISMSEQTSISVLPGLLTILSAEERPPRLHIKRKINTTIHAELDSMEVDLAVGWVPNLPLRFHTTVLYHEQYVIVVAKNNPLWKKGVGPEIFSSLEQIAVRQDLSSQRRIDKELALHGATRNVVMNVSQYQVVPKVLQSTSLISVLPRSVILDFDRDAFYFQELPFPVEKVEVVSVIHRTRRRNVALKRLQAALLEACSGLDGQFGHVSRYPLA